MPGRREEEERKRKRAAASCIQITKFLKPVAFLHTTTEAASSAAPASSPVPASSAAPASSPVPASSAAPASSPVPASSATPASSPVPASSAAFSDTSADATALPNDIGLIVNSTMTAEQVANAIGKLSAEVRFNLLKRHSVPDRKFEFPSEREGGCNRSFQWSWLEQHLWLVYSTALNGAFCIECALFAQQRSNLGILVNKPFTSWRKKSEVISKHANKQFHIEASLAANTFTQNYLHPDCSIEKYSRDSSSQNFQTNLKILKFCIEAVLFCGRQCISLRNRQERSEVGNPGNFIAMLRAFAVHDDDLAKHLATPAMKNATYISPKTQNELINIIGREMIQKKIVDEIKEANFFTILADEVESHHKEVCSLCVRFVDVDKNIREEFLDFVPLVRTTGEHIGASLIKSIKDLGLNIDSCRGQGYDGCSAMSSEAVGVQAVVKRHAPNALYVHCFGHCLNLVIAHSCKLVSVRNTIDALKEVCLFFLHSPKKLQLLEAIVQSNIQEAPRRKAILDLCKTRWVLRDAAYGHFYNSFTFIVKALEAIAFPGVHQYDVPEDFRAGGWDTESRSKASSLLRSICSFDFILTFLVTYKTLSFLQGITIKLQGASLDILEAFSDVEDVKNVFKSLRKDPEAEFKKIYEHAIRMADSVNVEPSKPRTAGRQQHRCNAPTDETTTDQIESYYLRNLYIPFLDGVQVQLEERFSPVARKVVCILKLLPVGSVSVTSVDLEDAIQLFSSDLPSPEVIDTELRHWSCYWENKSRKPTSPAECLKKCDEVLFPNIFALLKLLCTLPVTSCECERSFSSLRRLNTYNRCSMTNERLTNLALIHIHYDDKIDVDDVVNKFCVKQPRRMHFGSVLKD
jgi:hypothetical protein